MIIAFTGIRDIDPASTDAVRRAVEAEYVHDPLELRFGGAIGADTYALAAASICRPLGVRTKLVVIVPFRLVDQPKAARFVAERHADEVRELRLSRVDKSGYFVRNAALVKGAARVVAFTDGRRSGGTYHTMSLARRAGLDLVVIPVRSKANSG